MHQELSCSAVTVDLSVLGLSLETLCVCVCMGRWGGGVDRGTSHMQPLNHIHISTHTYATSVKAPCLIPLEASIYRLKPF